MYIIVQLNLHQVYKLLLISFRLIICTALNFKISDIEFHNIIEQMNMVGPGSLIISLTTAFFVSMVFTLQVAKEFLYLNAVSLIGAILTLAFIRELSPVLTSVILIGRVGSCFTAELATMQVTEQMDALYLLNTNPILYLVIPRIISCVFMLPILTFLSFSTSIASSAFICFTLYGIHPITFFASSASSLSITDLIKSLLKTIIFGFIISLISCAWGLGTKGGAKGVGKSTTASVVTSLLAIFILDFILSYLMFNKLDSSIKTL
uniref:probable ABC transporter permease protein Ycf63 n=1 Tax=Anunuuluaehu liula TaxID=3049639 RepID=UPI003002797B